MKLVRSLLGHHSNRRLRTILSSYHRGVNLELLQGPDGRQVGLCDHFIGAHVGDVASSALPRVVGGDSVHREVTHSNIGSSTDDGVGVSIADPYRHPRHKVHQAIRCRG